MLRLDTEPWMKDAECAGTPLEMFFPTPGKSLDPARRLCDACPVRRRCLDYALENRIEDGMYGGTTSGERTAMLKAAA